MMVSFGNKKNILLVVRWPVGGIRTFLKYVYGLFDSNEWKFTIIAPSCDELQALKNDLCNVDVSYVEVKEDPSYVKFIYIIFLTIIRGSFDVVHSQGFTSAICATLPSALFNKPHILTSHDVINERQFQGLVGKMKKFVLSGTLLFSKKIHSVSNDAQNNLQEYFPSIDKNKMLVIPNGIQISRFRDAVPKNFHSKLQQEDSEEFLIGFFGRFMGQKGFRYLIDAIELLSKIDNLPQKPVVMAFGWGGFIREEQRGIKERGLERYFRFMPFEPDVAAAIKGLDVVVMPSLWEACPLLPMETLVCGVPLIATQCVGLREVISDTPAIKIEMNSGESIASAIVEIISNPLKNEFENFIPIASERFDVLKQSRNIKDVYLSFCV